MLTNFVHKMTKILRHDYAFFERHGKIPEIPFPFKTKSKMKNFFQPDSGHRERHDEP